MLTLKILESLKNLSVSKNVSCEMGNMFSVHSVYVNVITIGGHVVFAFTWYPKELRTEHIAQLKIRQLTRSVSLKKWRQWCNVFQRILVFYFLCEKFTFNLSFVPLRCDVM